MHFKIVKTNDKGETGKILFPINGASIRYCTYINTTSFKKISIGLYGLKLQGTQFDVGLM